MRLSQNFTLAEFCFSETAARMGIKIEPTEQVITNLSYGCKHVLQPIRDLINSPIIITSGYRPDWLNRKVGGSSKSQHCFGQAADFKILRTSKLTLLKAAKKIEASSIPFDQLIYETGEWIHVSWAMNMPSMRRRSLTMYRQPGVMFGAKSVYVAGLHDIDSLKRSNA